MFGRLERSVVQGATAVAMAFTLTRSVPERPREIGGKASLPRQMEIAVNPVVTPPPDTEPEINVIIRTCLSGRMFDTCTHGSEVLAGVPIKISEGPAKGQMFTTDKEGYIITPMPLNAIISVPRTFQGICPPDEPKTDKTPDGVELNFAFGPAFCENFFWTPPGLHPPAAN